MKKLSMQSGYDCVTQLPTRSEEHQFYWLKRLEGELPDTDFIRDFIRLVPYRMETAQIPLRFSATALQRVIDLSPCSTRSVFCFLLAITKILLARYTRSDDVIVGCQSLDGRKEVLPVRSKLPSYIQFDAFLQELDNQLQRDYEHQNFEMLGLLKSLDKTFGDSRNNLTRICFCFEDIDGIIELENARCNALFRFRIKNGQLEGELEFNKALYSEKNLASLPHHFFNIIESVVSQPRICLGEISLLGVAEKRKVLFEFNCNEREFPLKRSLPDLFEEQVTKSPDTIAVKHNSEQITYSELNIRANKLAIILRQRGVLPGKFVAILEHRSINFLTAMLAIWKAGGAYIPIDPTYPIDRVRYMLINSEVSLVVSRFPVLQQYSSAIEKCRSLKTAVFLSSPNKKGIPQDISSLVLEVIYLNICDGLSSNNIELTAKYCDPAYMIYTSGSTGKPKGAIIRFDGAVNHIYAQFDKLNVKRKFRFLQSAPSSSDISVWQFVAPLLIGDTTVIVDDVTDIENVFNVVKEQHINIVEVVPIILKYLINYAQGLSKNEGALPALQWMMVTGETAPVGLVNSWLEVYPSIPVLNAYGPTEASDDIVQALIESPLPENQLSVPIGQPLANCDVYVLDRNMEPAPLCVPGEICVAGIGVGVGYWKNEEMTRTSFVPNPFPESKGAILYKTGDLGRWLPEGNLEFLGRIDEQVQVRGFRIELGEIEEVLRQHPAVHESIVSVFTSREGDRYLVGYAVPLEGCVLNVDDVLNFLASKLTEYMIPSTIVLLNELPLTPAGKFDRKKLPDPVDLAINRKTIYSPPCTDTEIKLVELIEAVLNIEKIGIDDNIFDLGADSINAVQIVVAARQEEIHLKPAQIFTNPTVALLASNIESGIADRENICIDESRQGEAPIKAVSEKDLQRIREVSPEIEQAYPLYPTQEGIFLQCLLSRRKEIYFDQFCYELEGELNIAFFQKAWEQTVADNPILRSSFIHRGLERPIQVVHKKVVLPFEYLDWRDISDPVTIFSAYLLQEKERGFKLAEAPLIRITIIRLGEIHFRMIWNHHHILLDGWSLALVLNRVIERYEVLCGQMVKKGRAASPSYGDYLEWLERQNLSVGKPFWTHALHKAEPFQITGNRKYNSLKHGFFEIDCRISEVDSERVTGFARDQGITLSTLLQGIWGLVLARISNRCDILFGSVVSGREVQLSGVEKIIGLFINSLPVRVKIEENKTLNAWFQNLQTYLVEMRSWEWIPSKTIQMWSEIDTCGKGLFDSLFVFSNYPQEVSYTTNNRLKIRLGEFHTTPDYPITFIVMPGDTLLFRIVYDAEDIDDTLACELLEKYKAILFEVIRGTKETLAVLLGEEIGSCIGNSRISRS